MKTTSFLLLFSLFACGADAKRREDPVVELDANAFDLEAVYSDGTNILGIDVDDPANKMRPGFFVTEELSEDNNVIYISNGPAVGSTTKTSDVNIKRITALCNNEFILVCTLHVYASDKDLARLELDFFDSKLVWKNQLFK